jgi:hypothetical protein
VGVQDQYHDHAKAQTQKTYKIVYPYLNLGLDLSLLSYDIAYLFNKTDSYRPWHTWLGVRIERKGMDDPVSQKSRPKSMYQLSALDKSISPVETTTPTSSSIAATEAISVVVFPFITTIATGPDLNNESQPYCSPKTTPDITHSGHLPAAIHR